MHKCSICPRRCGVDRESHAGFCGVADKIRLAKAAPHFYEEPPVSGTSGSGCIFFSGCVLKCVFCQNYSISRECSGREITEEELCEIILGLQSKGVHNINLVTPTQFAEKIAAVLKTVRPKLRIPVIYNCGGYESKEALNLLDGLIDVYLPDLKYFSPDLSLKYSACKDYFAVAIEAIKIMTEQVGAPVIKDGLIKRGVIVRHMILPSCRKDSERLLYELHSSVGTENILLSLMHQYTPDFLKGDFPELSRKVTTFEYNSVLKVAKKLGFNGFSQDRASADTVYTPDFNG